MYVIKKLLGIVALSLLLSGNAYADKSHLGDFKDFLEDNAHRFAQYKIEGIEVINVCKVHKKNSKKWLKAECNDRPGGTFEVKNKLKIKFYKGYIKRDTTSNKKVNLGTLLYYGHYQLYDDQFSSKVSVERSKKPYEFDFDLRENKDVTEEINSTGLLSYLLFENGKIVVDEITPKNRFRILFNNGTKWTSASVGKSITSYVTGHAICGGYIDSINSEINDWPLIKNTLYDGQKLINLLNMAAGDQKFVGGSGDLFKHKKGKKRNKNPNNNTLKFYMSGYFKNSEKSESKYNYSNIIPNIVLNYVYYKSNGDFQKILDNIFKDKAGIKNNSVSFMRMNSNTVVGKNLGKPVELDILEEGPLRYSFLASRYDYLRIAKAMMDDWNNDTCVGKYLKTIYENRIPKDGNYAGDFGSGLAKSYGGFFHTDFSGIDRPILGMNGFAGQDIVIDPERSKITVINAIHNDYDWDKIVYSVIK